MRKAGPRPSHPLAGRAETAAGRPAAPATPAFATAIALATADVCRLHRPSGKPGDSGQCNGQIGYVPLWLLLGLTGLPLAAGALPADEGMTAKIQSRALLQISPTLARVPSETAPASPVGTVQPMTRAAPAEPASTPVVLKLAFNLATASDRASATGPAAAAAAVAPSAQSPQGIEMLLVDLTVNGQRQDGITRAENWPGGELLLAADAWKEARLLPLAQRRTLSDGTPAFSVNALAGATYRINRQSLSIDITAPPTAFAGSTLGLLGDLPEPPQRPETGMLLNYDVTLGWAGAGNPATTAAALEAIAFSKYGNFTTSALLRRDGITPPTAERLDTFWHYAMPHRLETLTVGDTVGTGGGWSRPVRFGGVRWGREFAQRPGFVTQPQITLTGEAALPSTVDLLVNNARRMSQSIPQGPFDITHIPVIAGAGEVNLVVRDLLGRETVIRQSYYASPLLLAPGLTDFSFEAGKLRSGYGKDSEYGAAFGAATWRQGLSRSLTGEVRMELQAERRAAGLELSGLLGDWAVGRVALAGSSSSTQGPRERGWLVQTGIERSSTAGGAALQYEHYSRGFAPFGEAIGPDVARQRARQQWLASLGGTLWGQTSGGLSYVSQSRWDGEQLRSVGASLSAPLWSRASLSVTLNKRVGGDGAWRLSASINMPLNNPLKSLDASASAYSGSDDDINTTLRMDTGSNDQRSATLSAARNVPAGPGLGWRVEASTQATQRARAGIQYNTNHAEFNADFSRISSDQVATRAGARGTLGLMAGLPFASRPIGQGSFAVVEVEGIAGVPVMRSHQVVAQTDSRGLALVPGLLPWQQNRIEIDPVDLPLDTEMSDLVQQVTPYGGSGAVVKFTLRRSRQALVVLHQPDGTPIPLGTLVRPIPGSASFSAGLRGEVWLTGLAAEGQQLMMTWPGGQCTARLILPPQADNGAPDKIGPIQCSKE